VACEAPVLVRLAPFRSSSQRIFIVPNFHHSFPITLLSLSERLTETEMLRLHYREVAQRTFGEAVQVSETHSGLFAESTAELVTRHVGANEEIRRRFTDLLGRQLLDGGGTSGCFRGAFEYYFTDSEQAFIKWLEVVNLTDLRKAKDTYIPGLSDDIFREARISAGGGGGSAAAASGGSGGGSTDTPSDHGAKAPSASSSEVAEAAVGSSDDRAGTAPSTSAVPPAVAVPHPINVTSVAIDLLSYLDMCPGCRGTISHLLRREEGQPQSWFHTRIAKLLQVWGRLQKQPLNITTAENFPLEIFCISLAQCIKGATS
jgi:hypothetical protein